MNSTSKLGMWLVFAMLLAMPVLAQSSVTRSVPASTSSDSIIEVSLETLLDGATYYAVDEVLPNSTWIVTGASNGGDWTSQAGHVKWVCFYGCANVNYTYNLTIPSAANGTYTFSGEYQMEGMPSSSSIGGSSILIVVHPAEPDFVITLSPSSKTILFGRSDTATVTLTSLGGYTNDTALTATLPSALSGKATVTFLPSNLRMPANGTNTSVMNVSVASNALPGIYDITVRGTGGGLVRTTSFTLTVPSCGNGVLDTGEACDGTLFGANTCVSQGYASGTLSCNSDCTLNVGNCQVSSGGGGGGGASGVILTYRIGTDNINLSVENAPTMSPLEWSNTNLTAIKIARVNLTSKIAITKGDIKIYKITLPSGITALPNTYQYFNFTATVGNVSLKDGNVSKAAIRFAVGNSWISSNGIKNETISLYRLVGSAWSKLTTTLLSSDASYTYYSAVMPGFSYLAIAGEKKLCPSCPEASEWSVCVVGASGNGIQTRTEYECSESTNYTCTPKTVTQPCCLECQSPSDWSMCIGAKQSRTAYQCSEDTNYTCEQYAETMDCVDVGTAQLAVTQAQTTIASAKASGKDVTYAESLMAQARSALSEGRYGDARSLATQAENAAISAAQIPGPPLFEIAIVLIFIAAVAVAATVILNRRKKVKGPPAPKTKPTTTPLCVVCGQPTTLNTRCAVCGQYACVLHLKTIAGKPYCTNCIKKMYR